MGHPLTHRDRALINSSYRPELGAAVLDAQRFLDLSKTYAIVVNEILVIGKTDRCKGGRNDH